jgi:hypothetical protein
MELSSPESKTARRRQRDVSLYVEEVANDAMYTMKLIWYQSPLNPKNFHIINFIFKNTNY